MMIMVESIKDLIKIKAGRRKLIGEMFTVFVGAVIQIWTGSTDQWIWLTIIYGLYAGFNVSSKWLSFKKSGNGAKSVT